MRVLCETKGLRSAQEGTAASKRSAVAKERRKRALCLRMKALANQKLIAAPS
jgi:hypothetical protein